MKSLLFTLISFVAFSALFIGIALASVPDGTLLHVPVSLLTNAGFKDFQIPGLVLMLLVGGVNMLAVFYNIQRSAYRYNWALLGGVITLGWALFHLLYVPYYIWLSLLYLIVSVLIVLIAFQLKGKALV
jgi:hypothetical protein